MIAVDPRVLTLSGSHSPNRTYHPSRTIWQRTGYAVGILTNSQILIVGAMVIGPEYGAILSLAIGVSHRHWAPVRRSAAALAAGFGAAMIGALLMSLIIQAAGLEPEAYAVAAGGPQCRSSGSRPAEDSRPP